MCLDMCLMPKTATFAEICGCRSSGSQKPPTKTNETTEATEATNHTPRNTTWWLVQLCQRRFWKACPNARQPGTGTQLQKISPLLFPPAPFFFLTVSGNCGSSGDSSLGGQEAKIKYGSLLRNGSQIGGSTDNNKFANTFEYTHYRHGV